MRKAYTTPDGTRLAPYAGFWRRIAARSIDWIICSWVPFLPALALLSNTGGGDSEPTSPIPFLLLLFLLVACVVGYFTYFWVRGRSLGMKAAGIQIINPKSGRPPGVGRAFVRACLALIFAASAVVLVLGLGEPPAGGFSSTGFVLLYCMAAVFVAGVLGHLWMIRDPRKQTWQDKVTGVVIVMEMAPVRAEIVQ